MSPWRRAFPGTAGRGLRCVRSLAVCVCVCVRGCGLLVRCVSGAGVDGDEGQAHVNRFAVIAPCLLPKGETREQTSTGHMSSCKAYPYN
jgi:hypothetical protein